MSIPPLQAVSYRRPIVAAAIVLATIIAYLPAINAGYIWDDDDYVTENVLLRDSDGLRRIWIPGQTPQYYPVVFTTFWVEYQIWQRNPMGYHVVNVLLHAANALLLWLVMVRLKVPGAWLIAAVFALHPVHVESVAWITERKNVLSLMFYLIAALAYLRFDAIRLGSAAVTSDVSERGDAAHSFDSPWAWYAFALGAFLLALLSKSVTCSLPAALILIMLWQRSPITAKRLLPLAPMFLIGFALAMNTAMIERTQVGALGEDFALSFIERTIIASNALLFYPWKLLWPAELVFIYPRWEIDATAWVNFIPVALVATVAIALLELYRRAWRGPFVALSFYAGTVFPAIGFFNVYPHLFSFVADHFVYHASIGVLAFFIGGAAYLLRSDRSLVVLAAPVLAVLFVLTYTQSMIYEDEETLWRDTIAKNPAAWMPQNNLGQLLLRRAEEAMLRGDTQRMRELAAEALVPLDASLEHRPHHHTAHAGRAEALRLLDRLDEALEAIDEAIHHRPQWPHYYWERGRLLELLARPDDAADAYRRVIQAVPESPEALGYRHDLARVLLATERTAEAAATLREVFVRVPNDPHTLLMLAGLEDALDNDVAAELLYQRAHDLIEDPQARMAILMRIVRLYTRSEDDRVRDLEAALGIAQHMVSQTGWQDPNSLFLLASVHAAAEHFQSAVQIAEQALILARAMQMHDLAAHGEAQLEIYRAQLSAQDEAELNDDVADERSNEDDKADQ